MIEKNTTTSIAVRLFAVARELDKCHKSNLAKYYYALALSEIAKEANKLCLPRDQQEFFHYVSDLNTQVNASGLAHDIVEKLQQGQNRLSQSGDLEISQFPPVFVSTETGEVSLSEHFESEWIQYARTSLLRPLEPEVAIDILRNGPDTIGSLLSDQANDTLTYSSKTDDWSILTILEHLILGETLLYGRAVLLLTEDEPLLEYLPVDLSGEKYGNLPIEVLRRYKQDRKSTLSLLEGVATADWFLRSGYHTMYGLITLQEHVSFFARYEIENIQRIRRKLAHLATDEAVNRSH